MAASSLPYPSSPSDSDSDREPNSRGARVFWGNLKTPERSRSNFVHPPQTVVKSQTQSQGHVGPTSAGLLSPTHLEKSSEESRQDELEEADLTLNPARLHNIIPTEMLDDSEMHDVDQPHFHYQSSDQVDAILPSQDTSAPLTVSPQLVTFKAPSLEAGSESDIEGEPVLQPSTSIDSLSPIDPPTYLEYQEVATNHQPIAITSDVMSPLVQQSPSTAKPLTPRASELPDLISFEMLSPPQPMPPDTLLYPSPHSAPTPPNQLSSSSPCATVDDLLSFSPVRLKSPPPRLISPSPHSQVSQPQPEGAVEGAVGTHSIPISDKELSSRTCHSPVIPPFSAAITVPAEQICVHKSSPSPSAHGTCASPLLQEAAKTSDQPNETLAPHVPITERRSATPDSKRPDEIIVRTPKQTVNPLPSTSGAETRKRSPAKGLKGKEKAHDADGSPSELPGPSGYGDDDANDRAAKKERRAKLKREAERTRQQLLSLSPTSAGVLHLLASPNRDRPTAPFPPLGLDSAVSELASNTELVGGSAPTEPATPQTARRVPILASSPQRREGSPLRFVRPGPVSLNDPNRTPARRVVVSPGSPGRTQPQPLPLDDPNRTPARRVIVPLSPAKRFEPAEPSAPRIRVEESSPMKQNSANPPAKSTSSKLHDGAASPCSTSLSTTMPVATTLPFPIRQNTPGGSTSVASTHPIADSTTMKQQPATSNLRQPSSVPTSKIARATSKPYSRPAQAPSRLPMASTLRRAAPTASTSTVSTVNGAGSSRPHPSPANLPSRIPSPVKRRALSVDPPLDTPTPTPASAPAPTSSGVNFAEDRASVKTTYKRKRQQMMSEDDSDEPPAKRPVIVVRPVIKGMYNKGAPANRRPTDPSPAQRDASPVRPLRPPGPIQIRPVIPGTLRHFETTRSSSRDLLMETEEEDDDTDTQLDTHRLSGAVASSPPKEETPLVDTDTASTVTTLSREPTVEELPESSSAPRLDSSSPVPTDPGPELRRTTRVRKPYGPDALAAPGTSKATRGVPMPLTRTTAMVQREATLSFKASSKSSTRTAKPSGGLPVNPRQLQALTDANTVHNQAYLADLQRKVVRRYGPRPASPTTKVRTIMEKSKEERSKEREARAERRRRRDQGSNVTASSEGDYMDAPSSPTPDAPVSEPGPLTRHARGPGDEEDYETPERPTKPSRFDPQKVTKSVKWDRGLARTISEWAAEQMENEAREGARAEAIRKGCLVRDPATLRLDPLGNIPDASVPLEDLGRERVVVTRFVYDDDVEAAKTNKKRKS